MTSSPGAEKARSVISRKHRIGIALGYVLGLLLPLALAGCWGAAEDEVVVYVALDQEFSEPILKDFEEQTGIRVLAKYDVESTKTVGLANAILAEAGQPRCDLFWNNEILHTLRLKQEGLLAPYDTPAAAGFPPTFVGEEHRWHGLAARARIIIVNTELLPDDDQRPRRVEELADPKWKERCGLAKPLFGTTATHAAVLFHRWGEERAKAFFRQVHDNAEVLSGNKQVAQAVGSGQLSWGMTDTDDAIVEIDAGRPVAIIFPNQGEGEPGALFIPNTLAIIQGGPNPENARRLVDFLLSPAVERRLATGPSAQFPLGPEVATPSRVNPPEHVQWIAADFEAAAEQWPTASAFLREVFAAAD